MQKDKQNRISCTMKTRCMRLLMLFLFLSGVGLQTHLQAQGNARLHISGIVKDETGEPLMGAHVKIKGTTTGTITDLDGKFSFSYTGENAVLEVSYLAYETFEQPIKGKTMMNITLYPAEHQLHEVQVVGYGTQKRVTVTGAISNVSGSELNKVPTASIGNMLSGVLSGVSSVQSSGQPGADNPEIYVRGIATLNTQNATPLMLVDGVERSFFQLDPNEIESITVLKDASSTAVFGVRGANGVIIVTTKRGTEGKAKVSGTFSYGIQQPTRLIELANSYEYATMHNEAMRNDGKEPSFSEEALQAFKNHSNPILYPDVDWMDMLLKSTAPQMNANVNVSGGTEKVKYFTSVGVMSQDGLFKNFDLDYNGNFYYRRYNYRANLDINFSRTSLLTINLGGRVEQKNEPNTRDTKEELFRTIYWATPMGGAGVVDGKWIMSNGDIIGQYKGTDGLSPYYGRGAAETVDNQLNLDLMYEQKLDFVTKGLKFHIKGAYNTGFSHTKNQGSSVNTYTPYYMKDLTWMDTDPNDKTVILMKSGTEGSLFYNEWTGLSRDWYAEVNVNYARDFGPHHVTALALYNQSKKYYPDKTAYKYIPTGYVGLVGRATYDYNSTYMIEFNVGYNGSENFKKGNRYGFFPAVSGGWILTQEKFMQGVTSVLNYLKVRASYGVVGNDKYYKSNEQQRFLYLPDVYYYGGGYNFGTGGSWSNGAYEGAMGNPLLGWEKAYKQNYGIDFSVFDSRLVVNVDAFLEKRNNILAQPQTYPAYAALQLPVLNLGKVENKGVELQMKWNDKVNTDFSYYVNFNLSYAKNKIVYMDEVPSKYEYTLKTGRPVDQPFGYKVRGFYYEGMPDVADHSFDFREGDVVYEDLNGDGVITKEDMTAIGYPKYPLLNAGLTLGFKWKGLEISALFVGATKTSRMLQETFRVPFSENMDRSLMKSQYEDRWTPATRETATLPIASFSGIQNNYKDSELWLKDASYLRLKNLEISYSFSFPFMRSVGMSELKIFANGYNLFTLDKLKIADPESSTSDRPGYPVLRVYNFGVNVSF